MLQLLSRLVNVRREEWPLVLLLAAMLGLHCLGWIWSVTILEAALYSQLGMTLLPWFAIAKGLLAVAAVTVYAAFADRVDHRRLLIAIVAVACTGLAAGLLLLLAGHAQAAYALLYLLAFIPLDEILSAHWFVYISSFYDTRAFKRLLPVITASVTVATIAAGLTVPLITAGVSSAAVFGFWLATVAAIGAFAELIERLGLSARPPHPGGLAALPRRGRLRAAARGLLRPPRPAATGLQTHPPSPQPGGIRLYLDNLREGARYVGGSRFLRWVMAATLLVATLLTLLQYQTGQVLLALLGDERLIANYLGLLTGVSNLLILPVQLFLLGRIVSALGVGGTNLIFPAATLAASAGLVAAPSLTSAGAAAFTRTSLFYAVGGLADNLLYNAVPLRVKGRARAFIAGLVTPAGFVAGGLLLLLAQATDAGWLVPALLIGLALGYLGCGLALRHHYAEAMVEMLARDDFSFVLAHDAARAVADPATLRELRRRLLESAAPDTTVFLARLIDEIGGPEASAILRQAAAGPFPPQARAAIIELLADDGARDEATLALFGAALADPDARVRVAAAAGLSAGLAGRREPLLARVGDLLDDPAPEVRAAVLPALLADPAHEPALRAVEALLGSDRAGERLLGLRIVGQAGNPALMPLVLAHIAAPDDGTRLAAAQVLEQLARPGLPPEQRVELLAHARRLATDPIERVRQAAVTVLAAAGRAEALPDLVAALADSGASVRARAIELLARAGRPALPLLKGALARGEQGGPPDGSAGLAADGGANSPDSRTMAAIALCRIDRARFAPPAQALAREHLAAAGRRLREEHALGPRASEPAVELLRAALRERATQLGDEGFALLAAIHPPEAVEVIGRALASDDSLVRANGTEALEALCDPLTARLAAAARDPGQPSDTRGHAFPELLDEPPADAATVLPRLAADEREPWLRALATYAMGQGPQVGLSPSFCAGLGGAWGGQALPGKRSSPRQSSSDGGVELEEIPVLSFVEKILFLRSVPFFATMAVDQLRVLAGVCEERLCGADEPIFRQGDPGGSLYVVVNGRVTIEQERRAGAVSRLQTLEARGYFGEASLFDGSPRGATAVALQDTLLLRLGREPLIALARQQPELALTLIQVLSDRLREANERVAELSRSRPREVQRLLDQL